MSSHQGPSQRSAAVPEDRIRAVNAKPASDDGDYVLYWMTAFRRTRWNFSLERAVEWSSRLGKPLLVLEAIRAGYRWASDRLHRFVLDGMLDNAARLARLPALYYPYLEPEPGAGRGLLGALGARACVIVTDDYPAFFLPRMIEAAAAASPIRLEAVDSNGLLPLRAAERAYPTAYAFRRFLQRELPSHLASPPEPDPLEGVTLPRLDGPTPAILERWPRAWGEGADGSAADVPDLSQLPIDHEVKPVDYPGGARAGARVLRDFLVSRLDRYAGERNQPDAEATSGLSPYLHFGHVSAHQAFAAVASREGWNAECLGEPKGSRQGWWGMSEPAEGFLDELVTWREVGFNRHAHAPSPEGLESLPDWARQTLAEHESDPRPHLYSLEQFERAATHDALWNAAQNQLVREGRIHNYLRMLWGKKVLHWTPTPREAFEVMVELNNKYAVDGRDPNSYTGILWILGAYDRAWGPERPVFGKVRYMSSKNTERKLRVGDYLDRYTPENG